MERTAGFKKRWKTAALDEMIDCPFQPGNLKISKIGCIKRRTASIDVRSRQGANDEWVTFSIRQGLLTCKNCPAAE